MAFDQVGEEAVRATAYDIAIKQLARYAYKMKQLVSITTSSSYKNYFFREQTNIPTNQAGNAIKGIPRGADFPNAVLSWEQIASRIEKYGLSSEIDHEDLIMNNIDVRNRTVLRIAEGVAKAVDTEIAAVIVADSGIQTGTLQGGKWNETSAAIIKDLATMKAQVKTYYDNASDFVCVIHPDNEPHVLHYIYEKGAQASTAGQGAFNGQIGNPAGVNILTSSVIDVSYALFVVPKTFATWKEVMALATDTVTNRFKGDKITACEYGVTEIHEPKQVVYLQIRTT
ncbi:MAG: hypothetical protein AAB355_00275 [Patescibacteria group bacterium]